MAENENRRKKDLCKMTEDSCTKGESNKMCSLNKLISTQLSIEKSQKTRMLCKGPTKSDIDLREMLKNPAPPITPQLSEEYHSSFDDSTLDTVKLSTEQEVVDTSFNNTSPVSVSQREKPNKKSNYIQEYPSLELCALSSLCKSTGNNNNDTKY